MAYSRRRRKRPSRFQKALPWVLGIVIFGGTAFLLFRHPDVTRGPTVVSAQCESGAPSPDLSHCDGRGTDLENVNVAVQMASADDVVPDTTAAELGVSIILISADRVAVRNPTIAFGPMP